MRYVVLLALVLSVAACKSEGACVRPSSSFGSPACEGPVNNEICAMDPAGTFHAFESTPAEGSEQQAVKDICGKLGFGEVRLQTPRGVTLTKEPAGAK